MDELANCLIAPSLTFVPLEVRVGESAGFRQRLQKTRAATGVGQALSV